MEFLANPWALWLLPALPMLAALVLWTRRGDRQRLARFANPLLLRSLTLMRPGARTTQTICWLGGATLLILAICGPQWGRERSANAGFGHELVVVLDLSRSMLAEKPSRQERARRALANLCDTLEERGGTRVALVVFAAHAQLLFPLTQDINHLRVMLAQLDADALPAAFRPNAADGVVSGTRIGQGLQAAVAAFETNDEQSTSLGQNILLLSDGDDPAKDDEWKIGSAAAQVRKIPVYTVSSGDTHDAHTIPYQGEALQHQGQVVKTIVSEAPLEEIARATGGEFLPGRTQVVPLGRFYREVIEPRSQERRMAADADAETLVYQQRYAWFLTPAFILLVLGLLLRERPRLPRRVIARATSPATAAFALAVLLLVGSESLPHGAELIHEANAAFTQGDFERAAALYDRAAATTSDPGLVAFNKAATLYRLERYAEAEIHYRRCLEDQEASALRKARSLFDLGNALSRQENTRPRLLDAIACYRACLQLPIQDAKLHADAEHNLAAAKMQWLKLPADQKKPPPPGNDEPKDKGKEDPGKDPRTEKKGDGKEPKGDIKEGPAEAEKTVQKMAAGGKLLNLPDDEKLVPLSPRNTQELLEREILRMLQSRRDMRQASTPIGPDVKDW